MAWDNGECRGFLECPPRCPRFLDKQGRPLLVLPFEDASVSRRALLDLFDCGPAGHSASYPPYRRREALDEWLDGLLDDGENLVVVDDEVPIGHAVAMPSGDDASEFAVFVAPEHRGRGIARELLRHVVVRAAEAGLVALVMHVQQTNKPMLAIAREQGFETVETDAEDDRFAMIALRLPLQDSPAVEQIGLVPARDGIRGA
jgi:ribosomal protein S18 acetylase RimI-like enzyme